MEKILSKDSASSMSFKKTSKVSSELMEPDKIRKKKEKLLRRFIPAIFTKDNQRDNYEKIKICDRRKHDKSYTHYQQSSRLNKYSDPSHLKNQENIHVNLNPSLSGSIIEERLNEIKHDLFPAQENVSTSTPEHFIMQENIRIQSLQKHTVPPNSYLDVSLNSLNIDVCGEKNKWVVDGKIISGSPNMRHLKHHKLRPDENTNQCALKRKYSFQETIISPFRRNCKASGRISVPLNERFLIRPRAIHPIDRPLPAIPQQIKPVNDYCNISQVNKTNNSQSVVIDTQEKKLQITHASQEINKEKYIKSKDRNRKYITETLNTLDNINHQLNCNQTEINFRCSPTTSLKSGDYADSSYTANSSQKSELSPTSSKSGEYYLLNSPHASNQTSSNDSLTDLDVQKISHSIKVEVNKQEFVGDKLSPITQFTMTLKNKGQVSHDIYESKETEVIYNETTSGINTALYDSNIPNEKEKKKKEQQKLSDLKIYMGQQKQQAEYNCNQQMQQNINNLSLKNKQEHSEHNNSLLNYQNTMENVLNNESHQNSSFNTKVIIPKLQIGNKKKCYLQESQSNDQILMAFPQRDESSRYNVYRLSQSESNHSCSHINEDQIIKRQQVTNPCKNNHRRPEPIYLYSSASSTPLGLVSSKSQTNYSNVSCKKNISVQIHSSEISNDSKFYHQIKIEQDSQKNQNLLNQTYQILPKLRKNADLCTNSEQRSLSSQKKNMMQHLEAYYWHQKAIDAQRRSLIGISTIEPQEFTCQKKMQVVNKNRDMIRTEEYNKNMLPQNQQICYNTGAERVLIPEIEKESQTENYERQIMSQKGQRQPVLVLRPQSCARNITSLGKSNGTYNLGLHVLLFNCMNSKGSTLPFTVYRQNQVNNVNNIITMDCGNTGPKRVSFSNQTNVSKMGPGQWPTKHGSAPEPPTRRNKAIESFIYYDPSSTNSLSFKSQELAKYDNCDVNKPLPASSNQSFSPTSWLPIKRKSVSKKQQKNESYSVIQGNSQSPSTTNEDNYRKLLPSFSESESGSETGEIQKIFQQRQNEEEWNADGKIRYSNESGGTGKAEGEGLNDHLGRRIGGVGHGIGGGGALGAQGRTGGIGSGRSRDEPRRHTLSGDHQPSSLLHQQFNAVSGTAASQTIHPLHPRHLPPPHNQYGPSTRHTTMDLETPVPRGYPSPSSAMLFDDDPGIMSEVETSSTGFRRGGKQRSSLPVVRTPSKTLERPLGLVFLQYRNETKRALLPNEITSIDTVKALFVRSFPKQLTMEYLDSSHVKIYIHDSNKDMFYELEDLRSHLRDIRDRSVLRLFESDGVAGMPGSLGVPSGPMLPSHWEDPSYFSEPEFDSEFQHQHIHKSKNVKNSSASTGYYMSGSSTLPRGGALLRPYSPATTVLPGPNPAAVSGQPKTLSTPDRLHGESGYMSSPERGGGGGIISVSVGSAGTSSGPGSSTSSRYPSGPYSASSSYEDPYYSQYSGTVTPVIDEEARIRVEHMERQLANLTGLVQKALTHTPHPSPSPRDYLQVPAGRDPYVRSADDSYLRTDVKPPKLGKDKSVSFEKSVSFSDEPPDMNSPKQHSPQHAADSKPTKPAIKSSTLPRMSSQERERHKPTPPPKPMALATGQFVYRDLSLTPEMYNQLRGLQKKAKDLRQEIRNLRRMSQAQAHTVRETIRDTFITIRATLLSSGDNLWVTGDAEKLRLNREEDLYKQEMLWLEKDLTGLESTVEELRGNVINRKTRVNMSDVENMALILSKASKTVADLKVRFPNLQEGMKGLLSSEMEKVIREEKFLKEEPDRLESALKRCKKLTGTLVTLKRLASVQEQRLPNSGSIDGEETAPITPISGQHTKLTNTGQRSMPNVTVSQSGTDL